MPDEKQEEELVAALRASAEDGIALSSTDVVRLAALIDRLLAREDELGRIIVIERVAFFAVLLTIAVINLCRVTGSCFE